MMKIKAMQEHMVMREQFHKNFSTYDRFFGYFWMTLFASTSEIEEATRAGYRGIEWRKQVQAHNFDTKTELY